MSQSTLNDIVSNNKEEEKPFVGNLKFGKRIITFSGTTVLLDNVTQYELYGITRENKISTRLMIISVLIVIASFFIIPFGLITILIFGYILYQGYQERQRPPLHGLTIELNSGRKHYFLSKDKTGVEDLFKAISEAVENNEPLLQSFHFEGDRIIGDKYEFNDSEIGQIN